MVDELLDPDVVPVLVDVVDVPEELHAAAAARTSAAGTANSTARRVRTTWRIGVLPFPWSAVTTAGEDEVPSLLPATDRTRGRFMKSSDGDSGKARGW
jgi:hypothetical protein